MIKNGLQYAELLNKGCLLKGQRSTEEKSHKYVGR